MRAETSSRHDLLTLLALCPFLGATRSLPMAAGLCAVVAGCVIAASLLQRALKCVIAPELKVATFLAIWTGAVTAANLLLSAFWPELQRAMGIYAPLLVTVALFQASPPEADGAAKDLLGELLVFCVVALALGAFRHWAGQITALALLPPGGLILAGLLLAAGNAIRLRKARA